MLTLLEKADYFSRKGKLFFVAKTSSVHRYSATVRTI
jgi:hypothetical protein